MASAHYEPIGCGCCGVLRMSARDDWRPGEPFDYMVAVVRRVTPLGVTAEIKGLRAEHRFRDALRRAGFRALREAGFTRRTWDRRDATGAVIRIIEGPL